MTQGKVAVTEQGIRERIDALAPWFHTIDLGSGIQIRRDMVHGGDPVSAPLPTGVLEFVVSVLQRAPGGFDFGGHVLLCRFRKQGDSG